MAVDLCVSQGFGSLTSYVYPGGYNQSQLGLGPCMIQANNTGNEGKWVGPIGSTKASLQPMSPGQHSGSKPRREK